MKISSIALLAGLGMLAVTLPAAAAPTATGSTDVRTTKPDLIQVVQNRTREINEQRGGLYKKAKKPKKKKKGKRK